MASPDLHSFLQIIPDFVMGKVESVHSAKINSRGRCGNKPPPSVVCPPKKPKLNPGFKAISEHRREERGSKVCRGPRASREAGADAQPQQGSLDAAALSLPGQTWLSAPLLAPRAEGTTSFFATPAPCQQGCRGLQLTRPLLHCSTQYIGTWAEPRHGGGKTKAKPRDFCGGTERAIGCVVSLGSLFFSLSFVTAQFLSPQHRATTVADGERGDLPPGTTSARGHNSSGQRHPPPIHPTPQETTHCLRPLFF